MSRNNIVGYENRNKTIINEIKTYFLLKPNKIDKLSNTDSKKRERENISYQYQELIRRYRYRSHRYNKNSK